MIPRLALLALCLLAALSAGEAPAEMRRVRELATQDKHRDEAVAMCRRIIDDDKRPTDERARAARLLPFLMLGDGKAAEARAEAVRLAAASPGQRAVTGLPELIDALVLARDGKRDEAVAALRRLAEDPDPALQARAKYHLGATLARGEKNKQAPPEVQAQILPLAEAAAAGSDDPWDARIALRLAREAAERSRDLPGQERVLRAWLRDPVLAIIDQRERDDTTARLGQVLEEGKRFDEARAVYQAERSRADAALAAVRAEGDALDQRVANERTGQAVGAQVRWSLALANSWRNQGDKAQAMTAADAVFNPAADPGYECIAASGLVIDGLAAEPDRALAAARTLYDATACGEGLKTLARLLAKGDGKQEKEIAAWLEHGSAGPDGVAGTADDLPARQLPPRAAFPARAAVARGIALTSGYMARRRANLLLFAGEPAEAAAVVRWWMGQTRSASEVGALAEVLSRCALALSGDPTARRHALRYVADGPAGPDGKPGTADDLADPLPGIAALAVPPPAGDDAVLLRRLRAAAARLAGDDRAQSNLRGNALGTVLRIDMLFSTRPSTDELVSWYEGNPGGIMDTLAAVRFAEDGHLAGLPEVQRLLDGMGFDKQPDWIRGRRKSWPEVAAELHEGKPSKAWW